MLKIASEDTQLIKFYLVKFAIFQNKNNNFQNSPNCKKFHFFLFIVVKVANFDPILEALFSKKQKIFLSQKRSDIS